MERSITREEFCQAVRDEVEAFATEVWQTVVEGGETERVDAWLREQAEQCYAACWVRR